jgi:hypothetical protein
VVEYRWRTFNVLLSSHAERQLQVLGPAAEQALAELERLDPDELPWVAESLPAQGGRAVWMYWAGSVRVLFDTEEDDLTIQGFGLRPGRRRNAPGGRRRPRPI